MALLECAVLDSDDAGVEQEVLEGYARVSALDMKGTSDVSDEVLATYDSVLAWHTLTFDEEFLKRMKKLKVIVRLGVGYDNVDIKSAGKLGIRVFNVPDYGTEEVADHALSHILNMYRRTSWLDRMMSSESSTVPHGPHEIAAVAHSVRRIRGQRLGLVGLGAIGTAVAIRAKAFGFRVQFFDPFLKDGMEKALGLEKRCGTLEELLQTSDCISLHCALTEGTSGMINAESISHMRDDTYIINTARGGLIVEEDVKTALLAGKLGGIAMDVHSNEPFDRATHPLADHSVADKVCHTPHSAWFSQESAVEMRRKGASTIRGFFEKGHTQNCVNLDHLSDTS